MHKGAFCAIAALAVLVVALPAAGAVIFSDGFESYNAGALDKNLSGGPNASPNGSGNPWFGPAPPNARVVGVDSGVSPHSGAQMVRGAPVTGADLDQNWVNIAYRFNGGSAFSGNLTFDWWYYDALGAGGSNFKDCAAIGFYNTAPATTDYPGTGSLNSSTQIQRLELGGTGQAGINTSFYQARVVGASGGAGGGWFDTSTPRSIGWHHGRIIVGPSLGDGTNGVSFFVDNMALATFTHNSVTSYGYNVLELNTKFGSQTGYFDDVSLSNVPEPGSLLALGAGLISLAGMLRKRR